MPSELRRKKEAHAHGLNNRTYVDCIIQRDRKVVGMARLMLTFFGAALLGGGVWLSAFWWPAVRTVLQGALAVGLVVLGVIVLIFGISELTGARAPKGADE
jgi:hypothetical protein